MKTFKSAFTMLELVFVIVVIGIISAVAFPRIGNSKLVEGTDQILSHIRYTQHLAMQDDKFDPANAQWFRNRWYIRFEQDNGMWVYSIGSANQPDTWAKNPEDNTKFLSGRSAVAEALRNNKMRIEQSYGLAITATNNCGVAAGAAQVIIHFDYLGRPMGDVSAAIAPYANLFQANPCVITFSNGTQNATISIAPETGFVTRAIL